MKNLIFGIILLTILSGCSFWEDDIAPTVSAEKTPFLIDVYSMDSESIQTKVEKTGRITARSSLTLNAKWVGEVAKIEVKEGSRVKAGTVIARLKDTLTNYDLQLAQAENTLKIQNASIETTRINLDNSIEAARIGYERAKQAYETLTGKNALQYDTVVNNNEKTLKSYNETFRTYLLDAEKNLTQLLYEGDKILWISTNFEYSNDGWESYLWVRVGDSKALAVNAWNKAYGIRGTLRARIEKSKDINTDTLVADFDLIAQSYGETRAYVDAMLYMIQNNVVWGWLPQPMQDGWLLAWNGYRSQIGGAEGGYNAWRAQTLTFFDGYKNTELATKLALASLTRTLTPDELSLLSSASSDLRITYENTKLTLADTIKNAKLSLEQAESGYKNAQALKEATLNQLMATKRNAEISLELARRNADNLLVRAPVAWTISKVLSSVWQSVATGTPLAEFTSNEPEVIIDIEPQLGRTLGIGETAEIIVDDKKYTGTIIALSSVAGKNLLSSMRISVENGSSIIGKTAKIVFYPQKDSENWTSLPLIPLEAVRIIAENEGEIRYMENGVIRTKNIAISGINSGFVETTTSINTSMDIILTDTTNYNPEKNILKIQ